MLILSEPPPHAPENPEVMIENDTVNFRWESTTNTQNFKPDHVTYSIELSVDNGTNWFKYIDGLKNTDFNFDNLDYGIPYKLKVKAHTSIGSSKATYSQEFVKGKTYCCLPCPGREIRSLFSPKNTASLKVIIHILKTCH